MNWRVWTLFSVIVVAFGVLGVFSFRQGAETPEPSNEAITEILVDLRWPYSGEITVSYPSGTVSDDDFQVVVGARQDAHEFLDQYFIPYEDPARVAVDRDNETTSITFPVIARDRLEFAFPQVSFEASWTPLWETLRFEVSLPLSYDLMDSTANGLESALATERVDGRWVLQGAALRGGPASLMANYRLSGTTP